MTKPDGGDAANTRGDNEPSTTPTLGTARGQVVVHDDFDDPLPDEIRSAFGE